MIHASPASWRTLRWGSAALLLLLPALAMPFSNEVNWGPGDFLAFAALLASVLGLYELATWRSDRSMRYRAGLVLSLATAFVLVWANLAVGLVGGDDGLANALLFFSLGPALLGSWVARGRARALAWTLLLTALTQSLVGLLIWALALGNPWPATAGFVLLWLLAAHMFQGASAD